MGKILKSGKVVIVLRGRYAGRKAVVVKAFDEGTKERKFGHCTLVGLRVAPRKTTKAMSEKKKEKRMRCTPFVKRLNYNHVMPTRYSLDAGLSEELSKALVEEALGEASDAKKDMRKAMRTILEKRYKALADPKAGDKAASGPLYFFRKLKF